MCRHRGQGGGTPRRPRHFLSRAGEGFKTLPSMGYLPWALGGDGGDGATNSAPSLSGPAPCQANSGSNSRNNQPSQTSPAELVPSFPRKLPRQDVPRKTRRTRLAPLGQHTYSQGRKQHSQDNKLTCRCCCHGCLQGKKTFQRRSVGRIGRRRRL